MQIESASMLTKILHKVRIVPVAILDDVSSALKTAELLLENEMPLIEVTLRTEKALECLAEISRAFPEMLVGAGSLLSVDSLKAAIEAGAKFAVSPCLDRNIIAYARTTDVPYMPGIATPSELHEAIIAGFDIIKVFPAANLGGVNYINAISSPFKSRKFSVIPTGGITEKNLKEYLASPQVIACGLSYIVDNDLIKKGDFNALEMRMKTIRESVKA